MYSAHTPIKENKTVLKPDTRAESGANENTYSVSDDKQFWRCVWCFLMSPQSLAFAILTSYHSYIIQQYNFYTGTLIPDIFYNLLIGYTSPCNVAHRSGAEIENVYHSPLKRGPSFRRDGIRNTQTYTHILWFFIRTCIFNYNGHPCSESVSIIII